jgi:hypothetical protein
MARHFRVIHSFEQGIELYPLAGFVTGWLLVGGLGLRNGSRTAKGKHYDPDKTT